MRLHLLMAVALVSCRAQEKSQSTRPPVLQYASSFDSLVGNLLTTLPPRFRAQAGMLLDSVHGSGWGMEWLVRDRVNYFTLDSLDHYSNGKPEWRVVAATYLSELAPGEQVVWADCAVDGKPDPSVAAVGIWRDTALTEVRYATRPQLSSRRFEVLAADRISCVIAEDRN